MEVKDMQPWQQRLFVEQQESARRLMDLNLFVTTNDQFGKLSADEQAMLVEQQTTMGAYVDILTKRVNFYHLLD